MYLIIGKLDEKEKIVEKYPIEFPFKFIAVERIIKDVKETDIINTLNEYKRNNYEVIDDEYEWREILDNNICEVTYDHFVDIFSQFHDLKVINTILLYKESNITNYTVAKISILK